jgi:hypothetical protein
MATSDFRQLDEDDNSREGEPIARTGANDHAWEREHRHPTATQARAWASDEGKPKQSWSSISRKRGAGRGNSCSVQSPRGSSGRLSAVETMEDGLPAV